MNETAPGLAGSRASAINGTRHVFVRGLEVMAVVGVLEHERKQAQRLLISVDLTVSEGGKSLDDRLENVVCYGQVVDDIKSIIARGHVNLIETLAEMIATRLLADQRVLAVRIRIEKPDIMPDCASVGIEIERIQMTAG